jgi:diguanylate cyclase (GGDEF)-like protein/PAS domain S-box-containing protein
MSLTADASLPGAEQYAGRDFRTPSQSVVRIADPARQRRENLFFWSLVATTLMASAVLYVRGDADGPDRMLLRFAAIAGTSMALLYAIRTTLSSHLDSESARGWRTIALAMVVTIASALLMLAAAEGGWELVLHFRTAVPIIPQAILVVALLRFPGAPRTSLDRLKLTLDVATVIAGGVIVAWFDIVTTARAASPVVPMATILLHASMIADLVLLLLTSVLWRQAASRMRGEVLAILAAGFFVHFVSLVVLLVEQRIDGTRSLWPHYAGPLAVTFIALAAWVQRNHIGRARHATHFAALTAGAGSSIIPYVAVLPGLALLLRTSHEQGVQPLGGLALGGVLLAVLAFARQGASAREAIRLSKESTERDGEARFRALIQHSSDVITIVDIDSTIRFISPSVSGVLGYHPAQLEGVQLVELLHPEDVEGLETFLAELARRVGPQAERRGAGALALKREWRIRHADGSWHTVDNVGTNLLELPVIGGLVLNTRDVTEQSVIRQQYMHQAFHDPLTDLANRSLFLYQVGHALARTQRQGHSVSVLFLDLDNFKTVNDSLGHAAGDRLLVEAARRLASCVRDTDLIARLGGDEFAVLLEEESGKEEDVDQVAERISRAMRTPFKLSGKEVFVSASIGIARNTTGESSDELVRNADVAMYVAKTAGKGKHIVFEPAMHAAALERLVVEADLRRAIEREEFFLEFQPIVVLQTGEICGAEALVRWQCRDRGTVPPGMFIPIAEETGLVVPLGRMVLRNACIAAEAWGREHGRPLRVTVNLSGRQLQEAEIVDHVREALAESGLSPQRLVLEITESMLMQHNEVSMTRLTDLKALGVSLAIDDFGTGYSSLSYLQRYPIDILKIDKAFVDAIDKGGDGPVLASAIVALGETLRMSTVAEGIETEAQRGQLLQLGCVLGQGFLFAPPLGTEDFLHLILARGVRSPLSLRRRVGASEKAA